MNYNTALYAGLLSWAIKNRLCVHSRFNHHISIYQRFTASSPPDILSTFRSKVTCRTPFQ